MPGLIGYMLAIVVTLGGYFAGLHWLINPPDPWQPNPKIAQSNAQQFAVRKRMPPVPKPAEASVSSELTAATEPDIGLAGVATPASVQSSENATARPIEANIVQATQPVEATRPVTEPAHIVRREAPAPKIKSGSRKRIEKTQAANSN